MSDLEQRVHHLRQDVDHLATVFAQIRDRVQELEMKDPPPVREEPHDDVHCSTGGFPDSFLYPGAAPELFMGGHHAPIDSRLTPPRAEREETDEERGLRVYQAWRANDTEEVFVPFRYIGRLDRAREKAERERDEWEAQWEGTKNAVRKYSDKWREAIGERDEARKEWDEAIRAREDANKVADAAIAGFKVAEARAAAANALLLRVRTVLPPSRAVTPGTALEAITVDLDAHLAGGGGAS
jgi:hypothetical protein